MTEIEKHAGTFVTASTGQWANLVRVVFLLDPRQREETARNMALAAGVGKSNLLRKMEAIAKAREEYTLEQIIQLGQARVMGKFVSGKKAERAEELVYLRLGMSPGLKQALLENFWRIGKVLKTRTVEHTLEFVNSLLSGLDENQLKELAGDAHAAPKS